MSGGRGGASGSPGVAQVQWAGVMSNYDMTVQLNQGSQYFKQSGK